MIKYYEMDLNYVVKIVFCNDFKVSVLERLDVLFGGISFILCSDGVNRFIVLNDS